MNLAASKLTHVASILSYKYGVEIIPCYHIEGHSYAIFIDTDAHDIFFDVDPFEFSQKELIEMNVEFEARN